MLQIELEPEVERRLIERARAAGLEPEAYASRLIAINVGSDTSGPVSRENLESFFSTMARHADKIPDLPDEAYTRESFYQDHD